MALFVTLEGLSKVKRLDYAKVKQEKVSFDKVCKTMTGKDVILAVFHDLVHVDCMGSLYPVTQFCKKQFTDVNHLVRGFADKQSQRAYCIFSSQAILKWDCPTEGIFNCQLSAKDECENLKPIYANSLEVFKSYYANEGPDKILNCIFNGIKITKFLK